MTSQNGFSYMTSSEGITILRFYGSETEVVVPASIDELPVVAIGSNAFCNCCHITKIVLDKGVQTIGDGAFKYCSRLQELTLPDGLLSVGKNAFVGCCELKEILFPASLQRLGDNEFPNGLRSVSGSALNGGDNREELALLAGLSNKFSYELREDGCTIIAFWGTDEEVAVPAEIDGRPVVAIGPKVFYDNKSLKKISLPAGLQTIGDYAFKGCDGLTSVSLPAGLQTIGKSAFYNCCRLQELTLPDGLQTIGDEAFYWCDLTEIVFPEGMQRVGKNLCNSLKKVSISGFQNVGDKEWDKALESCRLQEIVLPDSWQSCTGEILMSYVLTSIKVSPNNPNIRAIDGVLFSADGKTLLRYPSGRRGSYIIPDGVERVAVSAFNWGKLQELVVPSSLQINDADTFCRLDLKKIMLSDAWQYNENFLNSIESLMEINVSPANPNVSTDDGVLFSADGKTLLKYPRGRDGYYGVPKRVQYIGDNAFACGRLNRVVFSRGLQSIGNEAFKNCSDLRDVSFPEGLQTIGDSAFKKCEKLRNVSFPEGLQSIGDEAFAGLPLTDICFPSSLRSIGKGAFRDCYYTTSVKHEPEPVDIWDYVDPYDQERVGIYPVSPSFPPTEPWYEYFYHGVEVIRFPEKLQFIGDYAFSGCRTLREVVFPEGLQTIGDGAFQACRSLSSVSLPEGNANFRLVDGVLFSADGKTLILYPAGRQNVEYIVPDGVVKIADYAFWGCKSLSRVSLPAGLQTIGDRAFQDCRSLSSVSFPEGLQTIGDKAFQECESLSSVSFPEGLQTIGDKAFQECESLSSVSFPEGLQTIGDSAFCWCKSLSSASLPAGLQTIGDYAFFWCKSLSSVSFPEGLQTIGDEAFAECRVKSAPFPDGIRRVGKKVFG